MYYKVFMICKHISVLFLLAFSMLSALATFVVQMCFVEDLLSKATAIRTGAESLVGMSRERFKDRLTWMRELLKFNATNWTDRKIYERVAFCLENFKFDRADGTIRPQPYCILLTGYPGTGKTTTAINIAVEYLKRQYGNAYADQVVTLNETDEFQSEYRSYHKVVIFDDLGAEKGKDEKNPFRKVLDFVNNIKKTALNPNVEMKGAVYIQPEVVILTTNLHSEMGIANWMRCPSAIIRRIKTTLLLDTNRELCSDITSEIITCDQGQPSAYDYRIKNYSGLSEPKIQRAVAINHVVDKIIDHLKDQESFIKRTNDLYACIKDKTAFEAFFDDILRPVWPKKIPLSKHSEANLPFYMRFARKFCVEENVPIMMMGKESTNTHCSYPKNEKEKKNEGSIKHEIVTIKNIKESDVRESNIDLMSESDSDESSQVYMEDMDKFIYRVINEDVNERREFEKPLTFVPQSGNSINIDDVSIEEARVNYILKYMNWDLFFSSWNHIKDEDTKCIHVGKDFIRCAYNGECFATFPCTGNMELRNAPVFHLDFIMEIYNKHIKKVCCENIQDFSLDIYKHVRYKDGLEPIVLKDSVSLVQKLNEHLPEEYGLLKTTPMAIVQYTLVQVAPSAALKTLGVEYPFFGYTPDYVAKHGLCYVIVECKNSLRDTGYSQIYRYMSAGKANGYEVYGVTITPNEYKIYHWIDSKNSAILGNVNRLIVLAISHLRKYGHVRYNTNHFLKDRCGAVETV